MSKQANLLHRILAGLEVILVEPERAREIAGDLHDRVAEALCDADRPAVPSLIGPGTDCSDPDCALSDQPLPHDHSEPDATNDKESA